MDKLKSIVDLISKLPLEENGWEIKDHWVMDLAAIGIIKKGSDQKLVYISTYQRKKGRYYLEIEKSTGDEETDFDVIKREQDVDFADLFKIMKMHLV